MAGYFDDLICSLQSADKEGIMCSPEELREQQFGLPLKHFAQQYLFGSTGLRIGIFHSISGIPQACKSPLLFDIMGHVAGAKDTGGLGGLSMLYELEGKISPVLLNSVLSQHGDDAVAHTRVIKARMLNIAFKHFTSTLVKNCNKTRSYDVPICVGFDSIGGSASKDTVEKVMSDGAVGKGFYDKAHFMKYFCENAGAIIGDLPMVIICINQEKEKVETGYGQHTKGMMKITGGTSQVYKDGFMVHATYNELASDDGKLVKLNTLKTSFSDDRKIEVIFRWNKYGKDVKDSYNHRFEWAMSAAKVIASPERGVGEIRDICDVRIAQDSELITCPTLGLRSVKAEEFEDSLMSEENRKVLDDLYVYLKIDRLRSIDEYGAFMKGKGTAQEAAKEDKKEEAKPAKAPKKTKKKEPSLAPFDGPTEGAEQCEQEQEGD